MSIDTIIIKIEPDDSGDLNNGENTDDATSSKQALDLSKKITTNREITQETSTPKMQPEFVNIKMEIDDTVIKNEPISDSESIPSNTCNSTQSTLKSEQVDSTQQRLFTISVKHEPVDEEYEESQMLEEKSSEENISNEEDEGQSQNSTADGEYHCPVCNKQFANQANVRRHMLIHQREKFECPICLKSYRKEHLKKHLITHSNVKSYDCKECGKKFRSTSNLRQHLRTHLEVKPFQCDICRRQFTVRANLLKHQGKSRCKPASVTEPPIQCHVCHKIFKRPYLLQSHLRRHTTDRPYACELCSMKFKYKSTIIRHMQLHNGEKPFSCPICSKKFTHAGLLKPHMRKHTGEKPYQCPVCSRKFAHKHNMERHTLRHAKIKHLTCEICHKKFPKESRLKYHMRTHTQEKPFPCEHCPKRFSHKQNAVRHYSRKHPGEVYDNPNTDASVARTVWENVIKKKIKLEPREPSSGLCEDEYVLP